MAISWREPEVARRRADELAAQDPDAALKRHNERWSQLGVVPVDEVQPLLERWFGPGNGGDATRTSGRLALLYPDTREVVTIPAALRGAWPQAWSPDRKRLLFAQRDGPGVQLFEYHLERKDVRPVSWGPDAHPNGCYGPDGRFVLVQANLEEKRVMTRIALTDPGGTQPEPISPGPTDHSPVCAPDGSSVVYVASGPRGRDQLFSVELGGEGTPRRLGPGREPAFSPDGTVYFSARVGDQWQIWRIRPDGGGRARIGKGVLDETHPAVSPDGGYVAYVVEEAFQKSLYLRRSDGSGDRILFRDGDADFPVW
jgi:hypothetical protein